MKHWIISHCMDSRYTGFIIVSSIDGLNEFHQLPNKSLEELGTALCRARSF